MPFKLDHRLTGLYLEEFVFTAITHLFLMSLKFFATQPRRPHRVSWPSKEK